ncbi:MAG: hypothetical protein ACRECM_09640 [Methyloceanibacter sp.]
MPRDILSTLYNASFRQMLGFATCADWLGALFEGQALQGISAALLQSSLAQGLRIVAANNLRLKKEDTRGASGRAEF